MFANPDLPGPLLKDDRPRHRHPTAQYKKECANDRPCAMCRHMVAGGTPDHHLIAKAHFKVPGVAKTYYDYLELYEGTMVEKDSLKNRVPLCPTCHDQWHLALGQVPEINEWSKDRRSRGIRRWAAFVIKNQGKRRKDAVLHDTVPDSWMQEYYKALFGSRGSDSE